jgi:exopolysaccharide biosynthesis polyprenyl glycosylphosphotransferase
MSSITPANLNPFGVPPTISAKNLVYTRPIAYTAQDARTAPLAISAKKLMDVVGAACGLILLSPLMALIAALIRLESPGPVLFRQLRRGRGGKKFQCMKFRTMVGDAEAKLRELEQLNESAGGVLFKIKDDPRVTRVGRVLRKTSLDELPQLWNVLKGEMSLVGPRPLQLRDCDRLKDVAPVEYARRLSVMPGLTGPWQVGGRSEVDGQGMIDLDLDYVETWSLALDVKILFRTVWVVLAGKGAC